MYIYLIRDIIKQDCEIANDYKNEIGQTCAIGALLEHAIGHELEPGWMGNKGVWSSDVWQAELDGKTVQQILWDEYHLDDWAAMQIQCYNDEGIDQNMRQELILGYLWRQEHDDLLPSEIYIKED